MKTILYIICSVISLSMCNSQQVVSDFSKGNKNIYIKDRFEKMDGYCNIFFVETFDSIASTCTFNIIFDNNKILSVKKYASEERYNYKLNQDGTVLFCGFPYFDSNTFKDNHKQSIKVYNLIHPRFFNLNNKERLEILNKLAH